MPTLRGLHLGDPVVAVMVPPDDHSCAIAYPANVSGMEADRLKVTWLADIHRSAWFSKQNGVCSAQPESYIVRV